MYGKIHDTYMLDRDLKDSLKPERRDDFEKSTAKFLFYSLEELREYIHLCDVNIMRGYNNPGGIPMSELGETWVVKLQLYGALKEHVRRQRNLDTLNFNLGEYELDRQKVSQVGERNIRDLGKYLNTRCD